MTEERKDIRNIAIIAHVDHGKTTLVDAMLKQAGTYRENEHIIERVGLMTERERGIRSGRRTRRCSTCDLDQHPRHARHAAFAEVERVLKMGNAYALFDLGGSCLPQPRFVLRKAGVGPAVTPSS